MSLNFFAGFPTQTSLFGTFLVITLPAPIIALLPIVIPAIIVALAPIDAPFFMIVFSNFSGYFFELGQISLVNVTLGPIQTSS